MESRIVSWLGHPTPRYLRAYSTDDHFYVATAMGLGLTAEQADAWLDSVEFVD